MTTDGGGWTVCTTTCSDGRICYDMLAQMQLFGRWKASLRPATVVLLLLVVLVVTVFEKCPRLC